MHAVEKSDINIVKILLDHHADPNIKSANGLSARDIASSKGAQDILNLLKEF